MSESLYADKTEGDRLVFCKFLYNIIHTLVKLDVVWVDTLA